MHVLIIPSEEFVPPESHLAGIFQLHQARALASTGVSVSAISVKLTYSIPMLLKGAAERCLGKPGSAKLPPGSPLSLLRLLARKRLNPEAFTTSESIEGIPLTRIDGSYDGKPSARFDHHAWTRAGRTAFRRHIDRHGRPDILHAHNALYAGMLARQLSRKHSIPYVITEHSSYIARRDVHPSLIRRAREVYDHSAQVVTVSPSLAKNLETVTGFPARKTSWIPNVIDPDLLTETPDRRSTETPVILAIASLLPIKDLATLLRSFAALRRTVTARLRIAGDGPEEASIKQLAAALDIAGCTEFLGRLPRQEVIEHLDGASCVALTSEFETFGVVLIEALARGKPVVATRCGGPDCIVDDSNGRLVEPGDPAAMAAALTDVLTNLRRYDPDAIREAAVARFGPDAIASQLSNLYGRTLDS